MIFLIKNVCYLVYSVFVRKLVQYRHI